MYPGAVPIPESLLLSPAPLVPLKPISTARLLGSLSPAQLDRLMRSCKGSVQCIHDTVASGSSELGLRTLEARRQFEDLALIYGEMTTLENLVVCFCRWFALIERRLPGNVPPIVTEPAVIRCRVNSTVTIRFVAQDPNGDPITFSLLYPRPPGASISRGETHTPTFVPPPALQMMLLLTFVSGRASERLGLCAELSQWMGHTERHAQASRMHETPPAEVHRQVKVPE